MSKIKSNKVQKGKDNIESFEKILTIPIPRLEMKFSFIEEEEKEESGFTFKNNLLSRRAYNFIKEKDECLAALELDDSIPNNSTN